MFYILSARYNKTKKTNNLIPSLPKMKIHNCRKHHNTIKRKYMNNNVSERKGKQIFHFFVMGIQSISLIKVSY